MLSYAQAATAIAFGQVAGVSAAGDPTTGEGLRTQASAAWFERAKRVLAGGVSSSARATTTGSLDHPLYIARGEGAHIWDVDGNEYVDYLISYGCAILGHGHPALLEAVARELSSGTMFGTCNVPEVLLAEQICRMVPCADLVRYANSGSEAVQAAVRAARGFTGRSKILKFEGHYHGWADVLSVSLRPTAEQAGAYAAPRSHPHSLGIPRGVVDDVVICPWNDVAALAAILDAHAGEIAAVICEPIVANNACTMPRPGFLQALREHCSARDVLLIFDETCTGFRVAAGGAQELFGVLPDLAVYAKALGGGFPIAAFAGRREVMDLVGTGEVKHGGTYNGSPLCATAALATLTELADPRVRASMQNAGETVMEAIRRAAADAGVPCAVQGVGAMFQVAFSADGAPTRGYRDLFGLDAARYEALRMALLRRAIHVNAMGSACWFVSPALTTDDVQRTCDAIGEAFREIA